MDFDRTFCLNKKCPLKNKCDRHYDRVEEFTKQNPDEYIRPLSVSVFEIGKDDKCQYFSKRSKNLKK